MNGELMRKRPAAVVARVPGVDLPRHEVIRRPTKSEALAAVQRLARDGEIGGAFALAETAEGYAVKVVRIREPRRGGFRWTLALALTASAALTLLAAWLLIKLLIPVLPFLVIAMVTLALVARTTRGRSTVTVAQSIVVEHR